MLRRTASGCYRLERGGDVADEPGIAFRLVVDRDTGDVWSPSQCGTDAVPEHVGDAVGLVR